MRLFVTGGAGFIGSNYVRHVLGTTDDEVTVFDALTYAGNLDNLRGLDDDPRFTFVKGDITDREASSSALDGHHAVVHFAAESHVDRSIVNPDEFIHTNGDGMNVRDWCYVEDNCAAVDLVLRNGATGEIYNIGAGNEVPNRFLTDTILALLGRDESMIEHVEDRLGHDRRYSIDISKVRSLGWAPRREFREALEATVAWYRDNTWWWEPLKQRTA